MDIVFEEVKFEIISPQKRSYFEILDCSCALLSYQGLQEPLIALNYDSYEVFFKANILRPQNCHQSRFVKLLPRALQHFLVSSHASIHSNHTGYFLLTLLILPTGSICALPKLLLNLLNLVLINASLIEHLVPVLLSFFVLLRWCLQKRKKTQVLNILLDLLFNSFTQEIQKRELGIL